MIDKEDFMEIKAQHKRGVYKKDIAQSLGVSPRTVSRALEREGPPAGKRPNARGSKLDPYKEFINSELKGGVWNATVILYKIRKMGYDGGATVLREYIKPKRSLRKSKATVRFETAPGKQMMSDWGNTLATVGGKRKKVHFCVNTLGHSRKFHFTITLCEDANHTYEAHKRAFEHFGGSTEEVLIDNQKVTVVFNRVENGERKVVYNSGYVDFLAHYCSRPRACAPYRARTKGKVENGVGYVKGNFFCMYPEADSIEHYNELAEIWLADVADKRVHGTTGEVVEVMFEREREHLGGLPWVPYDTSYVEGRIVAWDAMVEVRGNRYAVPDHLCGQPVEVRIGLDGVLKVFSGDELVATHEMRPLSEGWVVVPEFHANLWAEALSVEKRPLTAYEEVTKWS
jgi:transposase